ncbi:hypothetical protein FBY22_3407 [Streptomyces sp. SLBN-31]|nr:hypothetical protein FBY22_3407 [Streptomyces sp. SLBN-31]
MYTHEPGRLRRTVRIDADQPAARWVLRRHLSPGWVGPDVSPLHFGTVTTEAEIGAGLEYYTGGS